MRTNRGLDVVAIFGFALALLIGIQLAPASFVRSELLAAAGGKVAADASANAMCNPINTKCPCGTIPDKEAGCRKATKAQNMNRCPCQQKDGLSGGICGGQNNCVGKWRKDEKGKMELIDPNAKPAASSAQQSPTVSPDSNSPPPATSALPSQSQPNLNGRAAETDASTPMGGKTTEQQLNDFANPADNLARSQEVERINKIFDDPFQVREMSYDDLVRLADRREQLLYDMIPQAAPKPEPSTFDETGFEQPKPKPCDTWWSCLPTTLGSIFSTGGAEAAPATIVPPSAEPAPPPSSTPSPPPTSAPTPPAASYVPPAPSYAPSAPAYSPTPSPTTGYTPAPTPFSPTSAPTTPTTYIPPGTLPAGPLPAPDMVYTLIQSCPPGKPCANIPISLSPPQSTPPDLTTRPVPPACIVDARLPVVIPSGTCLASGKAPTQPSVSQLVKELQGAGAPPPIATISTLSSNVKRGESVYLTWGSAGAQTCSVYAGTRKIGGGGPEGELVAAPLQKTTTFTVRCVAAGKIVEGQTTVFVQ